MTIILEKKNGEKRIIVPHIEKEKLIKVAESFLKKCNPKSILPVDIESIVTKDLGLRIIAIPRLFREFGIRSYTDPYLSAIYIDAEEYDDECSARVTIAHEVSHILLHGDIFKNREFKYVQDYLEFQDSLNKNNIKGYAILEKQASFLAPYILLPQKQLKTFIDGRVEAFGGFSCMVPEHFQILVEDIKKKFMVSKGCIRQQITFELPDLYRAITDPSVGS